MRVEPASAVVGHIAVPGDKSISHRALLVGALAEGETLVRGFGRSADTESTAGVLRALGVEIEDVDVDVVRVRGVGLRGLEAPADPLDCGNAGTLARLLSGVLAVQPGTFVLTGDDSLSRRPMERIAEPLRQMGARVETTDGHLPVTIEGGDLAGIDYTLPVASAQVKSAILLAGLGASGRTKVVEPIPTRDHTELLLHAAGARVTRRPHSASVQGAGSLRLAELEIPGDFSSAAPFVVAAALLPGSELTVHGVGLNPRRTGLIDVLDRMGARISVYNRRTAGGEQVGDVEVRAAPLVAASIGPADVPLLVDELPLWAIAAAHARGRSRLRGARELRAKESDRLDAVTSALRALGVRAEEADDGLSVRGVPARPRGGTIDARGDHRIAMLGAVAGLVSREGVELGGPEAVAISFPGFFEILDQVAQRS
jgi:3-phosphoshikimate 1-carboxyvinyltransferase